MFPAIHRDLALHNPHLPIHRFRWLALLLLSGVSSFLLLLLPQPVFAQAIPFALPISLPGAMGGSDVALGDVDNDGNLDIFVANPNESTIWLNKGNSTFERSDQKDKLPGASAILLGDLDNDGALDAFLLSEEKTVDEKGKPKYKYSGRLLINRSGIFQTIQKPLDFGDQLPENLSLQDSNGDQALDIVTKHKTLKREHAQPRGIGGLSPVITELVTDTFVAAATVPTTDWPFYDCNANPLPRENHLIAAPHRCAIGDLDGNGQLDVVTIESSYQIAVKLNGEQHALVPNQYAAVALGDLDGDGDLDAVMVSNPFSVDEEVKHGDIRIWFNQRSFFKMPPDAYPLSPAMNKAACEAAHLALADLDRDQNLDLVALDKSLWGQGKGKFIRLPLSTAPHILPVIAAGDMNGDGLQDIFDGRAIWQNDSQSRFTSVITLSNSSVYSGQLADLDQDGDLDIFARQKVWGQDYIFVNNGQKFQTKEVAPDEPVGLAGASLDKRVILTDLNDDSYPDAILYQRSLSDTLQSSAIRIAFGDGIGQFSYSEQTLGDSTDTAVVTGDFNGDRAVDIVTQNGMWFNDGTGYFLQAQQENFNQGRPQIASDFDTDGDLDLYVVSQTITSTIFSSIWLNDGNGLFNERIQSRNEVSAIDAVGGDLNHDGYLDVATLACQANTNSSTVTPTIQIYLNQMGNAQSRQLLLQPIDPTGSTKGNSSSHILTQPIIPITYTLSIPARRENSYTIRTCYSLNDGNDWQLALAKGQPSPLPEQIIQPKQLAPPGFGCPYPLISPRSIITVNSPVVTEWDTLASGLFGQNDNVRFRIEAVPDYHPVRRGVAGSYQWPSSLATTSLSFRVLGTQVQVYNEAMTSTNPLPGATVYRLPLNQAPPAMVLMPSSDSLPIATNDKGLLPGRRPLTIYDTLVALWPTELISTHEPAHYYIREKVTPIIYRFVDPRCGPRVKSRYPKPSKPNMRVYGDDEFFMPAYCNRVPLTRVMSNNDDVSIDAEIQKIGDIKVWLSFTKTTESNLHIKLVAPGTAPISLVEGPIAELYGYTGHVDLMFDDAVTETKLIIRSGASKSAYLAIRPAKPLKQLIRRLPNGEWRLSIANSEKFWTNSFDWGMILRLSELYYTSAKPTSAGLDMARVSTGGTQVLTVRKSTPLLLFPLDVALEWDARNDQRFLERLEKDLKHTSEYLYDWTNGQVALGRIRVYHDAKRLGHYPGDPWSIADVRIYASNQLRPNAAQGGIVDDVYTDTLVPTVTYASGHVNIGAVWNRFGDTKGNQDEDWPRTLAHELGHYLLFLDDNYLGENKKNGLLVSITDCTGAMADQYSEDNGRGYDEFHLEKDWDTPSCQATLSNRTQRWDWKTITTFYPALITPTYPMTGPVSLPIDVTQVRFVEPHSASEAITVRNFLLPKENANHASANARPFLLKDCNKASITDCRWLLDLGHPQRDLIGTYGAQEGDRLCIFDLNQAQGHYQSGCRTIQNDGNELAPELDIAWQPQIQITPYTPQAIEISVTLAAVEHDIKHLFARLYPEDFPETALITLNQTAATSSVYTAIVTLTEPALTGYIHVWAGTDKAPLDQHELITDYAFGGRPSFTDSEPEDLNQVEIARIRALASNINEDVGQEVRRAFVTQAGSLPGSKWPHSLSPTSHAFVMSSDGQVFLFAHEQKFDRGQYFSLQATTLTPRLPSWATLVGQAYYLAATSNLKESSQWQDTSINFGYFEGDVHPEEEPNLALYFSNGGPWERLSIQEGDPNQNRVSAKLKGPGFYALLATIRIPVQRGWSLIGYPTSAITASVSTLLESFVNTQTLKVVYGYDNQTPLNPWQVYAPHAPAWVSDLKELRPGHGYVLYTSITQTTDLRFKGADLNPGTSPTNMLTPFSWLLGSPPAVLYASPGLNRQVPISNSVSTTATAQINGVDCGQGQAAIQANGIITYVVKVQTGGISGKSPCSVPGSPITLTVAGITTSVVLKPLQWDILTGGQEITDSSMITEPSNVPTALTRTIAVTVTSTSIPTPVLPPTATLGTEKLPVAPNNCELLSDGGFEQGGAWKLPVTDSPARIVIDPDKPGDHILRLGLRPNDSVHYFAGITFSSAYQTILIPSDAHLAQLHFRYQVEHIATHDHWRAALIDPATHLPVRTFVYEAEDPIGWKDNNFDVTAYRGRRLWLYFETSNDRNDANGRTSVLVDDVSLHVCY